MNIPIVIRIGYAMVWLLVGLVTVRGGETNSTTAASHFDTFRSGDSTNGFGAAIRCSRDNRHEVVVDVRQTVDTNTPPTYETGDCGPLFLGATNDFCGPIELRDVAGRKLPLLKPDVGSLEAYPPTLKWSVLLSNEMRKPTVSHRVPGDRGVFGIGGIDPHSQLGFFTLRDYFDVNGPGEYQLTVWPKIYRRMNEDKDLYQRIDVPPVTASIKLDGR